MKVSVNWVKQYLNFDLPPTDQLVERIGAQLGAVEEVTSTGAMYKGAVVVKVAECTKLENSDHLNLCFIDDGGVVKEVDRRQDGLVQVVCGAPNVKAGLLVVWLPPGSTVPSTYHSDPFVLEARELRGTVSNGMLASPKELAISDSHEGLWVIDESDAKPGASLLDAFRLDDTIIDIENKMFTHRPDCFGQLGVAREVAGILDQPFTSPQWYTKTYTANDELVTATERLSVTNEIPELCPRYMAVVVDNISIGPSPAWLQTYLSRVGLRPINNIVDLTNYMMVLTGQPLHAFDFDKIAIDGRAQIVVRNPKPNEELTLLDGKTIKPREEAIIIATPEKPIALGGIKGGGNSEIDDKTTRIVIECANFDMYNIRRTSMQHGLFTDAVTRFNKGQSEWQCAPVLDQAIALLKEWYSDSLAISDTVDYHRPRHENQPVKVSAEFVNQRLGLALSAEDMAMLLTNVEFTVKVGGDDLEVMAPFWRTDIESREDVVEEVGRLHGFDKLPLELPKRDITPAPQDALLQQKTAIRNSLAKAGAHEVLTYSFVHGDLLDKVGQPRDKAFKVGNALSPDLQYYRFHALPSLLEKVHPNIKAGYDEFSLFELNKGHDVTAMDNSVPTEIEYVDFVYASKKDRSGAAYFMARQYLDVLARDLGVTLSFSPVTKELKAPATLPYDHARSALVSVADGGPLLGIVGEFKASVRRGLKLPTYAAGFTVDQQELLKAGSQQVSRYRELPRFPKVEQDICLRVAADLPFQDLLNVVTKTLQSEKPADTTFTVGVLDIYKKDNDTDHQQITFRVSLASFERTLTDQEMAKLLQRIVAQAAQSFKAEQV